MLRKLLASTTVLFLAAQFGCYNTYRVSLDELAKVQEGGGTAAKTVKTDDGAEVLVTENSKLGVTDTSGTYHEISPFNFTMTSGQLVAPDEDLLMGRDEIETGNVKVVSGQKTALLVTAGVLVAVGSALVIALTAEDKKEFGE